MSDKELDKIIYQNLNKEETLRMRAVEYTIDFLKDKQVTKFDAFDDVFNRVYNSLINGPKADK